MGRPDSVVRISRSANTLHCLLDTYLAHNPEGYRMGSNPVLDMFSVDGNTCVNDFVYFGNWQGATYAVLSNTAESGSEITAFRVTPDLDLKQVCVTKKAAHMKDESW